MLGFHDSSDKMKGFVTEKHKKRLWGGVDLWLHFDNGDNVIECDSFEPFLVVSENLLSDPETLV